MLLSVINELLMFSFYCDKLLHIEIIMLLSVINELLMFSFYCDKLLYIRNNHVTFSY